MRSRFDNGVGVRVAVTGLFFVSGFAALLYQVVWQRLLALFSGVDVFSVTLIVSAFMAGLGLGNLAGGQIADRVAPARRLLLFGAAEAAVAGFALVSKWLYYDVLYGRLPALGESPVSLALVLFAALFWPTFFMGLSLPLLAAAVTHDVETASTRVGVLYGWNTLGAAFGAFFTAWFAVRHLGFDGSLRLGALLNAVCALGAFAMAPALGRLEGGAAPGPAKASGARPPSLLPFPAWLGVYAVSGFVALSLEIVWFRLLGVMIKATAFTFGTLLAIYLAGLALGSLWGVALARRAAHPARSFFAFQAGIGIYAGASIAGLVVALGMDGVLESLGAHLSQYDPIDLEPLFAGGSAPPEMALLYGWLPLFLVGPPTFLMGLCFPYLQRVVQTDAAFLGRRVGWLQTANIAGSMLGAIGVGWLLLDQLGTPATLQILVGLGGAFGLGFATLATRSSGLKVRVAAAVAVAVPVLALIVALPGRDRLWAALHGKPVEDILVAEDGSGVSLLWADRGGFARASLFANGRGQGQVPYGGIHTNLGSLPVFLHPNPRDVALIGLGSGDTLFAIAGREETESIVCFEIIEPQLETLERLNERSRYGGLTSILEDERIDYRFTDGRAGLLRSDRKFDVIEADALRPTSAYAGYLYSEEFFQLVRDRLKPGGIAVTWVPTERTGATFMKVFPHVWVAGSLAVGSNEPIEFDRKAVRARASSDAARRYYGRAGIESVRLLAGLMRRSWRYLPPDADRGHISDVNTDLYPKDEYLVP